MMVSEDTNALRRDVDKLMNQLKELNIDSLKENIKQEVEQESIERDHPQGSPYFTFYVDDDPNDRFLNTVWVRIEENTYLVSAGSNLVGMTPIGSNTKTLTTSNLPNHNHSGSLSSVGLTTNSHSHRHAPGSPSTEFVGKSATGNLKGLSTITGGSFQYHTPDYTTSESHTHSIDAHNHTMTINTNGSGESFDNRPKSLAIYMWRRVA